MKPDTSSGVDLFSQQCVKILEFSLLFSRVEHTFTTLNSHVALPCGAACFSGRAPEELEQRLAQVCAQPVPGAVTHRSRSVEMTQGSIQRCMDRTRDGILFGLKKEGNSSARYSVDRP